MKLRLTIQNEITEGLDSTCFTTEDFLVTFGDTDYGEPLIDIFFKHSDKFMFRVSQSGNGGFYISMSPGQISDKESTSVSSIAELIGLLPAWAMEVRNELKAGGTIYEEIDNLRDLIAEQLGSQSDDDEFSVEEINSLQKKFRDLEARVVQLEKDKMITEKQLSVFKSGIEQVSDDIEYYPKETWLKTAPNKIVKLIVAIGKSKEGRKVLAEGAKKLLGLD